MEIENFGEKNKVKKVKCYYFVAKTSLATKMLCYQKMKINDIDLVIRQPGISPQAEAQSFLSCFLLFLRIKCYGLDQQIAEKGF